MTAPTFSLPITGSAPNEIATSPELEAAVQAVVDALWAQIGLRAVQSDVTTGLAGKAALSHSHAIADVTGLQAALDGIASDLGDKQGASAILAGMEEAFTTALKDKLDAIEAGAQVNTVTSVNGETGAVVLGKAGVGLGNVDNTADADKPVSSAVQTALDGKAATSHSHSIAQVTGLQGALDAKAAAGHGHAIADVTGLQAALDGLDAGLDGKAAASHSHPIAQVTGLQGELDGKAAASHSHSIAQVTGLQAALDGKAAGVHHHDILDVTGLQAALNNLATLISQRALSVHGHANASASAAGFMSADDKVKLTGIASGATRNETDTALRRRESHLGEQPINSVKGLVAELDRLERLAGTTAAAQIEGLAEQMFGNRGGRMPEPGQAPARFREGIAPGARRWTLDDCVATPEGRALRVTGPRWCVADDRKRIGPGDVDIVRIAVRRGVEVSDPAGDAVRLGVVCYGANGQVLPGAEGFVPFGAAEDELPAEGSSLARAVVIGRAALPGVEVILPAAARYYSEAVRAFGENPGLDVLQCESARIVTGVEAINLRPDAAGPLASRSDHDAEPEGFVYLATDQAAWEYYVRVGASGWAGPNSFRGGQGAPGLSAPEPFYTRAAAAAWIAGNTIPDFTPFQIGALRFITRDGADTFEDIPGAEPAGSQVQTAHWGVVPDDPAERQANVDKLNRASAWCLANNRDLAQSPGDFFVEGRWVHNAKVRLAGMNTRLNWRAAPVVVGASQPGEMYFSRIGCRWLVCGQGTRDLTESWVTDMRQAGAHRTNPRPRFDNEFDQVLRPRNFANGDAVGATPATLRPFSCFLYVENDTLGQVDLSNITMITCCDGVSADGGFGVEGYTDTMGFPAFADYDVGIFVKSPWEGYISKTNVLGYWHIAGMIVGTFRDAPVFEDPDEAFRGNMENFLLERSQIQSGLVIMDRDYWPVLKKNVSEGTIEVEWTPNHQFASSGRIRIGRSFTRFSTYEYNGVTYDAGTNRLTLAITSGDVSEIWTPDELGDLENPSNPSGPVKRNVMFIFFSGGAGPATSSIRDCNITDRSRTNLVAEPGEGLPTQAGLEIRGPTTRLISISNTRIHCLGQLTMLVNVGADLVIDSSSYAEPRQSRITPGGATLRASISIMGPSNDTVTVDGVPYTYNRLVGFDMKGACNIHARFRHASHLMSPYIRIFSGQWFTPAASSLMWNPRALPYNPFDEVSSLTRRFVGNVGRPAGLFARDPNTGFLVRGVQVFPETGYVGIGTTTIAPAPVEDPDGGGGGEEGGEAAEIVVHRLVVGGIGANYGARLRGSLEWDQGVQAIRNDGGGLATIAAPTGGGLRYIAEADLRVGRRAGVVSRFVRLGAVDDEAAASGTVVEYQRGTQVAGSVAVYLGRVMQFLTPDFGLTAWPVSPEGNVVAPEGSECLLPNGERWRKASGSGNTGWVCVFAPAAASVSAAPRCVGQAAVVAGVPYIAVGTGSAADWKQIAIVE